MDQGKSNERDTKSYEADREPARAFTRMQRQFDRGAQIGFAPTREQAQLPRALPHAVFNAVLNLNAGISAGVFFGPLIRRFGPRPSRRISRPSAAFISVNSSPAQRIVRPFAPMNNPYRPRRSKGAGRADGFSQPGL